jgi:transposase-like protein
MSNMRRTYSPEFKREAIELCHASGTSIAQVAAKLNIPRTTLSGWTHTSALRSIPHSDRRGQSGRPRPGPSLTTKEVKLIVNAIKTDKQTDARVIWRNLPIDPEWVQYFGYTLFGQGTYEKTQDQHTGIDLGKNRSSFNPGAEAQFEVRAQCTGRVIHVGGSQEAYKPGHVRVAADGHPYILIFGHLVGITLKVGDQVGIETTIGYLDKNEIHLHLEVRHKDRSELPVNPWWFLPKDAQLKLAGFMATSSGTTFVDGKSVLFSGVSY